MSRLEDLVDRQTCTVGWPLPGTKVEVVDSGDQRVGAGQIGELRCRVPGPPELRWYATGDLVTLDGLGHVRIVGRKTEIIVGARPQNVHAEGVERDGLGGRASPYMATVSVSASSRRRARMDSLAEASRAR